MTARFPKQLLIAIIMFIVIGLAACSNMMDEDGKKKISVSGVSLNKTSTSIDVGSTERLVATIDPVNATEKGLVWESSNESCATVDSTGLVTAVAECSAIITVTASGGLTANCQVQTNWVTGNKVTYTADGVSFVMIYVEGGYTFPTGVNDDGDINNDDIQDVPPTAIVNNSFWLAETEVTYELWSAVYEWAVNGTGSSTGEGQYTFSNSGGRGCYYNGSTYQPYTSEHEDHPVTYINWRDSIIWCNALTEWLNAHNGLGTDLDCVYYSNSSYSNVLRISTDSSTITRTTAGTQDMPYIKASVNGNTEMPNCIAKGYRLLTSDEWECSARYIDGTLWLYGDHASGDQSGTCYEDGSILGGQSISTIFGNYAVYRDNSGLCTEAVQSKIANSLGLYDMSGNLYELCFDWSPTITNGRVMRGGSLTHYGIIIQIGQSSGFPPYADVPDLGFRFTCSE